MNSGIVRLESLELMVAVGAFLALAPLVRRPAAALVLAPDAVIALEIEQASGLRSVRHRLPITIGRAGKAELSVDDPLVSREHARIAVSRGRLVIEDCGSKNGTIVNGAAIDGRQPLEFGDEIVIGTTRLVVQEAG